MKKLILIASLLVPASVFAQQPQQLTPLETAMQMDAIINQWAQALTQQAKTIEQLQARVKELEAKEKPEAPKK